MSKISKAIKFARVDSEYCATIRVKARVLCKANRLNLEGVYYNLGLSYLSLRCLLCRFNNEKISTTTEDVFIVEIVACSRSEIFFKDVRILRHNSCENAAFAFTFSRFNEIIRSYLTANFIQVVVERISESLGHP